MSYNKTYKIIIHTVSHFTEKLEGIGCVSSKVKSCSRDVVQLNIPAKVSSQILFSFTFSRQINKLLKFYHSLTLDPNEISWTLLYYTWISVKQILCHSNLVYQNLMAVHYNTLYPHPCHRIYRAYESIRKHNGESMFGNKEIIGFVVSTP